MKWQFLKNKKLKILRFAETRLKSRNSTSRNARKGEKQGDLKVRLETNQKNA